MDPGPGPQSAFKHYGNSLRLEATPLKHIPIDAILTQRSDENGLTKLEINRLLHYLNLFSDEEVTPILYKNDSAVVFGFMRTSACDEKLNFDTGPQSEFAKQVLNIVNNKKLESPDGHYDFAGVSTFMYY